MKKLDMRDILGGKGITVTLFNILDDSGFKHWLYLSLSVIVPLLILSAATIYEGRFFLGSITTKALREGETVLGMSFLGDTMVWPYCLLVPLLIKIVFIASRCTAIAMNRLCERIIENRHNGELPENFQEVIEKTLAICKGEFNVICRLLRILPFVIALVFWTYNTATCTFHNKLGTLVYPYSSNNISVLNLTTDAGVTIKKIKLEKAIALPKWDSDLKNAPLSTLLTRIWTIFFYGLPPFLLCQLILMIYALTYFLQHFRVWADKAKSYGSQRGLIITPFAKDGFNNLGFIADTGMAFFYASFIFILLVLMAYLKEGIDPSWHNYLLLAGLIPISIFTFLIPAAVIRNTIKDAKDNYLNFLCLRINKVFLDILGDKNELTHKKHENNEISMLKIYYDQVQSMPVWPFSVSTILKILLTLSSPVAAILIQTVLGYYFSLNLGK